MGLFGIFSQKETVENIKKYFENEVKPHLKNAWMDTSKNKVG